MPFYIILLDWNGLSTIAQSGYCDLMEDKGKYHVALFTRSCEWVVCSCRGDCAMSSLRVDCLLSYFLLPRWSKIIIWLYWFIAVTILWCVLTLFYEFHVFHALEQIGRGLFLLDVYPHLYSIVATYVKSEERRCLVNI